jgi:hypothetical protein
MAFVEEGSFIPWNILEKSVNADLTLSCGNAAVKSPRFFDGLTLPHQPFVIHYRLAHSMPEQEGFYGSARPHVPVG